MEAIFLSFSIAVSFALFISKQAKEITKDRITANKEKEVSERFISRNNKSDDFLDYSGGLLGI